MVEFLRKHFIGIFFTIIGIVASIIILRFSFFVPKPVIKIYLADAYNVARTDKKIDSLTVLFKGKNIATDSVNLLVRTIKIRNKGYVDIKQDDYSQRLGLKINNCKIIYAEVDKGKKDSLSNKLTPLVINDSIIQVNNIPLDCDEEVSFNVYLLYKWNEIPLYNSIGKITGSKEIPEPLLDGDDDPFFTKEDRIIIPVIIISELAVFALVFFIKNYFLGRQITRRLNPHGINKLNSTQEVFIKLYKDMGKKQFIKLIAGLTKGEEYLKEEADFINAFRKVNETRKGAFYFIRKAVYISPFTKSIEILKENNLLLEEDYIFTITQELKETAQKTLNEFVSTTYK